jgi:NTE family protein
MASDPSRLASMSTSVLGGSPVALNPASWCEPSQNGLLREAPQRHNVARKPVGTPSSTMGARSARSCGTMHSLAMEPMYPSIMLASALRTLWITVLCLGAVACATDPHNTPRNLPALPAAEAERQPHEPTDVVGESSIALAFSGGGIRAAAFALGALQGLNDVHHPDGPSLLDDLSFITSVSGGSMTAAYYGLHGKDTLTQFRDEALLTDGEADLRFSLFNPWNIARALAGGLNDRDSLYNWLDRKVYRQATFGDMFRRGKPLVWINATNFYHRLAFPFHQRAFDALCSDLASLPLSEAVAASMAVPVFFAPIVLEKHPEACKSPLPVVSQEQLSQQPLLARALLDAVQDFRDTGKGRYIKLIDGGITDNYGLASIRQSRLLMGTAYGPLTRRDALTVRRMLVVVVDAGQGPSAEWNREAMGPAGVELAAAAIDAAIDANVRISYDSFLPMVAQWQKDIIAYRCGLPAQEVQVLRQSSPAWRCDDVQFSVTRIGFSDLGTTRSQQLNAIPTRLHLPPADVDAVVTAGRDAIQDNAVVQAFGRGADQAASFANAAPIPSNP